MTASPWMNWLKRYRVLVLAAALYFPLIFFGYGSDYDAHGVVWAGKYFVKTLDYVPSRSPGFLVHETMTLILNTLGGSLLTNLGSLCMALVFLGSFLAVARRFQLEQAELLTLIMAVHPYTWVSAASTIDYFWALGFAFLGFYLLLDQRPLFAGIALGLAVGSRISTGLVIAAVLLFVFITQRSQRKQAMGAGAAAALVAVLCYLPTADFVEWSWRFLKPTVGDETFWSLPLRLGRFGYKNVIFWSLPGFLALVFVGAAALLRLVRRGKSLPNAALGWLGLAGVLAYEVFFYQIPTEISYLLPTLPFWMLLLGVTLPHKRRWLLGLAALVLISNFVTVNVARPNVPNQATGAEYGLWVEPGHLVKDFYARQAKIGYEYPDPIP